jgi:Tfp pilus assembly protein PilF
VDLASGINVQDSLAEIDFQYLLHMLDRNENKERAEILTTYGLFVSHEKRNAEAERIIQQAIELNPKDPFAYVSLGMIMYNDGRKDESQRAYEKAISLDKNNFDAHYNLAHLFLEWNKLSDAEGEFQKAIKIDSTDLDSRHQIDSLRRIHVNEHGKM